MIYRWTLLLSFGRICCIIRVQISLIYRLDGRGFRQVRFMFMKIIGFATKKVFEKVGLGVVYISVALRAVPLVVMASFL